MKAATTLLSTPTITTGQAPDESATSKTAHLPMKPEVSGIPAMASRKRAKTPATRGECLPSPAQRDIADCSPAESRTSETTAKAPSVASP